MSKKTAVERLKSEVLSVFPSSTILKAFDKAMRMERKQIIEAWDLSRRDIDCHKNGEEYYNETYKGGANE